jgi:hypothetical protein
MATESELFALAHVNATVTVVPASVYSGNAPPQTGRVIGWVEDGSTKYDAVIVELHSKRGIVETLEEFLRAVAVTQYRIFDVCYPLGGHFEVYGPKYLQAVASLKKEATYPHTCTNCKSPALQLFNMVDCSNCSCKHYRR